MQKENGFTLVELMVVIVIIGILAAVAVPKFQDSVNKAHATEAVAFVVAIKDAENVYAHENDGKFVTCPNAEAVKQVLGVDGTHSSYFTFRTWSCTWCNWQGINGPQAWVGGLLKKDMGKCTAGASLRMRFDGIMYCRQSGGEPLSYYLKYWKNSLGVS